MVDIVHSDNRGVLLRKIGYSSGLNGTRAKVSDLVELYSSERQIKESAWIKLVTAKKPNGWENRQDFKTHYENFFETIGILTRNQNRIIALPTLEALTILKELVEDEKLCDVALNSVLLFAFTIAGGELLANLISTRFVPEKYESQLAAFREAKLLYLYKFYKNENDRRRLHRCVDFLEMPGAGKPKDKHQGPFANLRAMETTDPYDFGVTLSGSWGRHVAGPRKSWAQDLGLWSESDLTDRGHAYLQFLGRFTQKITKAPVTIIMPTDLEFSSNYLTWRLGQDDLIRLDDLIVGLSKIFVGKDSKTLELSHKEIVELVRKIKVSYATNDVRLTRIRKELPLPVFALVLLGLCVTQGYICPSLQSIVEKIQESNRGVLLRKSRNSLYALIVARK